ncbi:MAG: hypothetical protein EOP10_02510 [Proteobacteria bacterium]|nr:MAG: hypothetical protein EOP10_02510 [Pseudomonadota bacterium]
MKERAFGSVVASAVAGLFVMSAAHAEEAAAPAAASKPALPYCEASGASCKGKSGCQGKKDEAKAGSCKGHVIAEAKDANACKTAGGIWKTK